MVTIRKAVAHLISPLMNINGRQTAYSTRQSQCFVFPSQTLKSSTWNAGLKNRIDSEQMLSVRMRMRRSTHI